MLRLLLFLALIQHITSDCPDSDSTDIVHDGVCTVKLDYQQCPHEPRCRFAMCAQQTKDTNNLMKPVYIHSDEEQQYWTSKSQDRRIVLAIECNRASGEWLWYDGSLVDYKPQGNYYYQLNQNCSGLNSNYYWKIDAGKWIWDNNGYAEYCVGQLPPLPKRDTCDMFTDYSTGTSACYEVVSAAENWPGAQNACAKKGAALASIHTQEQNEFVRKLAASKGARNGLYLGSSAFGGYNESAWDDESDWDFDNRYSGDENAPSDEPGSCLVMDTFSSKGQWMGADCASKLPYVCVSPYSAPTCSEGPWKEGETITSPGYPYDASLACDYKLTVAPGKFVQVQIDDLQANSCCDNLILADGTIGSELIAQLSGLITSSKPAVFNSKSNVMRVSWQPNGAVNVKGFKMTYRAVDTPNEGPLTTTLITTTATTHTHPTTITSTTQLTTRTAPSVPSRPPSSTIATTTRAGAVHGGATLVVLAVMSLFIL